MTRFENDVADVPPERYTFHRCGAPGCDAAVHAVAGERHVRHIEYDGGSVTRTVYCSNRCLFTLLLFSGDTDD